MASSQQQPRVRPPGALAARYARPVLAGLILIIAVAGVRAAAPAAGGTGPWHQQAIALAAAAEAVLALLLAALWILARRRPEPGYPAAPLRAALLRVTLLVMAAIAVLAALSRVHPPRRPPPPAGGPSPALPSLRPLRPPAPSGPGPDLSYVLYGVLALLLAAAIAVCVLLLRRAAARPAAVPVLAPADDEESLRAAVESGRRALRSFDDAQAAIIACYAAMESSLARAGAERQAAETPDELLARAAESGLLRGPAAARLTTLFYEARFSSHVLPRAARDEAVAALDAIAAELARPAAAGAAPAAAAAGTAP